MSGLENSEFNGYYPADNAIVAYNTIVNSVGPAIRIGVGNISKGKPFVAPQNVKVAGNLVINAEGKDLTPLKIDDVRSTFILTDNYSTNGNFEGAGCNIINENKLTTINEFKYFKIKENKAILDSINQRLAVCNVKLSTEEMMHYNPKWKLSKTDVGANWIKY
jgi:hypothetical protein